MLKPFLVACLFLLTSLTGEQKYNGVEKITGNHESEVTIYSSLALDDTHDTNYLLTAHYHNVQTNYVSQYYSLQRAKRSSKPFKKPHSRAPLLLPLYLS